MEKYIKDNQVAIVISNESFIWGTRVDDINLQQKMIFDPKLVEMVFELFKYHGDFDNDRIKEIKDWTINCIEYIKKQFGIELMDWEDPSQLYVCWIDVGEEFAIFRETALDPPYEYPVIKSKEKWMKA